jgi:predicted transcriptional regulator
MNNLPDWKNIIRDIRGTGMTQVNIAAACGTTQAHISEILGGKTKGRRLG